MSKFYTIPAYSGGALGGLMLGAARGEGDSYDKGWTGLLTGLGTTAGIGGSHYLTKQLENWDDKLRANSIESGNLSQLIAANAAEVSNLNQILENKQVRERVLDTILNDEIKLRDHILGKDDAARFETLNNIYQAAGGNKSKYEQDLDDFLQNAKSKVKSDLNNVQNSINRLNNAIAETSAEGSELTNKLTSVKKYLNKPMNRLAKKVPLISGLKWLSAIALPAAGFAGAKSLGDYFSSKA